MTFDLHGSCLHGLIISMDGFVLPSFMSTCILKDKDLIMIKKSDVLFQDIVKFCGSQNQEQDLQSRQIPALSNKNLANLVPLVDSQYENDTVLFDRSTVHIETASQKINECRKRKCSNELQGPSNTLAIKDSQGDSPGDEEIFGLYGNMPLKVTASNEMINAEHKNKHFDEFLTSDTLANKDSQADSQVDKGDLGLPIPPMETSSSDMIKLNRKRKHYDKLQGSDDTRAIKVSRRNSQIKDEANDVHGKTAEKETTSNGMMHAKCKRRHSNELQAYLLKVKNSSGDSQVDDGDLCLPNGKIKHKETSCGMKNAKHEGKRSNKSQGSYDTLAITEPKDDSKGDEENVGGLHGNIMSLRTTSNETMNAKSKKKDSNKHYTSDTTLAVKDSRRVSPGDENEVGLHNVNIALRETPSKVANVTKRKHSKKLLVSGNKSKGNDDRYVSKNEASGDATKVPSRSARRKKAKRIFYRTLDSEKKKIEIPEGDNRKKTTEYANVDQNTKAAKEIVPVIVRPGHMRFESPDTCSVRADEPVETFRWNGTTSKKKGQKWGKEKTFKKWNDYTSHSLTYGESSNATEAELVGFPNEKYAVEKVENYKEPIDNHVVPVKECNGNSLAKEAEAVKELIELESLLPLIHPPEEGDVLAYRMVELSSSWCPELSPFRVGRVSSYDSSSSIVVLLPLPEYPIILKETSEEGQESRSLYGEDGTLEVDFPSLVDVRLFKARESIETNPSTNPTEEMHHNAPVNNQKSASPSSNGTEIIYNHEDNQLGEGWEAIKQALNKKKSQLQNQTELDKRNLSLGTTTTGPWSYRALKRNALGPTLAMLRSSDANTAN